MYLHYASDTAPFFEKWVITLFIFLLFCQQSHPSKTDTVSSYRFLKELKEIKKDKGMEKSSAFIVLEKCHKFETLLINLLLCLSYKESPERKTACIKLNIFILNVRPSLSSSRCGHWVFVCPCYKGCCWIKEEVLSRQVGK